MIHADITAQAAALAAGQTTSVALTELYLAEIARRNPQLNAFLHVDAEGARAAAAASDARRQAGGLWSPIDGISVALKDNIDAAGLPTTAGMATRRGRLASHGAFVVQRLRAAGAVLTGKLNMHEAALGATNHNPFYGRCENPHRAGFTPGGSSGGSACAVAAGLCAFALGTDTMGSVRLPAAYCGVVGFKPSFGRVSTRGVVACSYALDHVGVLARSQRDLALLMPLLAVYDAACADARQVPQNPAKDTPGFVVASDLAALGATPAVLAAYEAAVQRLRAAGHAVTAIELASYDFGRARRAGLLIVEADLLVEHAQDWREQAANFSPELTRFMRYGERQSAAAYAQAQRVVAQAHVEVARWFAAGDVMLLPTAPQQAFSFDDPVPANQADLTSIANMAGVPALSLPLPVAAGELPIGLQCIAPVGQEATLLTLKML
jgi:Asp-tRNA(Asn)/Glu-tRNA(Gln) amidotransferase A subunit family amidase